MDVNNDLIDVEGDTQYLTKRKTNLNHEKKS